MSALIFGLILNPLLLALMMLIPSLAQVSGRIAPWASLPALIFAIAGESTVKYLKLPTVLFGTQLGLDGIGRIFLFLTALLWLASSLSTAKWVRESYQVRRYWFFHLLTLTGNLGVAISQDAGSFYTFFALMTFSGFGLIAHDQSNLARTAGRVYLSLAIIGEMLILAGLILASHWAGSVDLRLIAAAMETSPLREVTAALIFIGFGVKVGLVPLHLWMPLSYSAAPVPAAAVLSGAMTKAGILGWIRFLPLGLVFSENWSLIAICSGVLMAFYGALVGLTQTHPKTALAYSSLSQMGYLTIAIGTALEPGTNSIRSLAACMAYAIHHGIAKAALFLGVAVVATTKQASFARNIVLTLLLLVGLSIVGVTFTGGAYVKVLLKESGSQNGIWHGMSEIVMLAGSIATALLIARIMVLYKRSLHDPSELNFHLILSWIALTLLSILSSILIPILLSAFEPDFSGNFLEKAPSGSILTITLTILLLVISRSIWARHKDKPAIPPGDLLIPLQHARQYIDARGTDIFRFTSDHVIAWRGHISAWITRAGIRVFAEFEKLGRRGYAGVGLLLLVWAAFWLILPGGDA